jgi:acyl-CoA synthetase (AMP-forming)/AMP-acid ligase II
VQNGGDPMTVLRDAGAVMTAARITRLRRGSDGPFDASAVGRDGREVPRYDSLPLASPRFRVEALSGQSVTTGYWGDPAQTEAAFLEGWLRTGDLGRIDDAGRVYLVDRLKDMINRGGENVFSVEVENALADAPGVEEVAVLGVPDAMMGEKVGCVIVPKHDKLDIQAVLEHAAERIADYKVPQYVAVRREPLPRNAAGKVLKPLLREQTAWGRPLR